MTLTSFDLVSDADGSVKLTSDHSSYEEAVTNAIQHLGYTLITQEGENDLIECNLVSQETNEVDHEFVSHSLDAALVDSLSIIGYTIYETIPEAELKMIEKFEEEEEAEAWSDPFEGVEEGKVLAFEL